MKRLCPDVPEVDDLYQTPDHAISRTVDKMHLVPPSGKPLIYDFEGYVLNRVAHDEFLVDLAKKSGARYLVGKRVQNVKDNDVIIRGGEKYSAKIIVDAGGHNGYIRKEYWNEKSLKIPVKFVLMDGDFGDAVELHFGSMAPGGYAWMFPKGQGANIGLGIQRNFSKKKSLNEYTEEFVSKYEGDITFTGGWIITYVGDCEKICQRQLYDCKGCCRNGSTFQWSRYHYCNDWRKNCRSSNM